MKSDYDETIYTTSIDRSNPLYKQRAAAAERIAREIESGSAMNAHMAEERGLEMADDIGMDEEQKYVDYSYGLVLVHAVAIFPPECKTIEADIFKIQWCASWRRTNPNYSFKPTQ